MVLNCAYPGCLNLFKKERLRSNSSSHGGKLTFHRFPTLEPGRLLLWRAALGMDPDTPMRSLRVWRICSEHFSPEDFRAVNGNKVLLKASAVPRVYSTPAPGSRAESAQAMQDCKEEETELLVSEAEGVSESRPQLHHSYTLPAAQSMHADEPSKREEHPEGRPDLNIIKLPSCSPSAKDGVGFPYTSRPAAHTHTAAAAGSSEKLVLKERQWIVSESSVMDLFRRCQQCGALITDTRTVISGCLLRVYWECAQRHIGQWNSCSGIQALLSNLCQKALEPPRHSAEIRRGVRR
ncbi:uncharacterized protein LOC780837 [Danio rerio]|uniref:THAP domain-containing protein 1 n=1 Tax=Danio rerio TaxID=7955 RepID=A0PJR4_DANRE|nr:uncharacterized protein LOC780837 [Danio rerio]AAI27583.1 Zgc:158320 [Danio rerio]|eukprot:NP_001073126.1 uncharacterized protein LOC780837 [Danio rerio]